MDGNKNRPAIQELLHDRLLTKARWVIRVGTIQCFRKQIIPVRGSAVAHSFGLASISHRILCCRLAAALLLPAMLAAGTVQAQDYVLDGREWAKTWAMHQIAVIQAAAGDVQGAKRTVSQISEDAEKGPSEVTAVWFCQGQPVYDHPPAPADCAGCNHRAIQIFSGGERATDPVPSQVPPGLPANYLDSDPRHGAVVEFADERDSHGTRVTSRTYADGHAVIETPH